jgi:minimal PKS acyl carrier protein
MIGCMGKPEMTIDDLKQILREAAGTDDSVDLDRNILDVEFADLGYDSVALLETGGRVELKYGVVLPDEAIAAMPTPRTFLTLVNDRIAGST